MARIHLTGASGYIGTTLAAHLRAQGHQVDEAAYRLPIGPSEPITADFVMHLAVAGGGTHHLKRSGDDDAALVRAVNVDGLRALIRALSPPLPKFVFLTTPAVYGRQLPVPTVDESAPTFPLGAYGLSKRDGENLLRASDLDYTILRVTGVFGAGTDGRCGGSFLNLVADAGLRQGVIGLYGGEQGIDPIYLHDLVDLIGRLCGGDWRSRQTYNVAGDIVTVKVLMQHMVEALARCGAPSQIESRPWTPSPGVLLSNAKLKRDFPGWQSTDYARSLFELAQSRAQNQ